jgi:hypothetical protein
MLPIQVYIKPQSFFAKMAAKKLKSIQCAIVLRNTIHIYGVTKAGFLADEVWLRHEVEHILQWKKYGALRFTFLYLYYSLIHGYYNNPFEVMARKAEDDIALLEQIHIISKS